jgi:hypothetical protein
LGSIDFFTLPTITGRILFVFVVLLHHRRWIVHFNVTEHPTAAWTAPHRSPIRCTSTDEAWVACLDFSGRPVQTLAFVSVN